VAVVVQEDESNEVLMLAWMNRQALEQSLESRQATYWSRSRNELWVKGATSGNTQEVVSASLDCDGDAILLRVNQKGGACHTGSHSCFSNEIEI
jgi:phosphoribosyl-AMP cyclohydrolase